MASGTVPVILVPLAFLHIVQGNECNKALAFYIFLAAISDLKFVQQKMLDNTNAPNQGKCALSLLICENNAKMFRKTSKLINLCQNNSRTIN